MFQVSKKNFSCLFYTSIIRCRSIRAGSTHPCLLGSYSLYVQCIMCGVLLCGHTVARGEQSTVPTDVFTHTFNRYLKTTVLHKHTAINYFGSLKALKGFRTPTISLASQEQTNFIPFNSVG